MIEEEESASGTVSFPPKAETETTRTGPSLAWRMAVLILSSAVGGWTVHEVLARFPHSLATYLLATEVFFLILGMGAFLAHLAGVCAKTIAKAATRRFRNPRGTHGGRRWTQEATRGGDSPAPGAGHDG